jgi:ubiquinone/menaquinone biosynthesis C-methylase UbiE
MQSDETHPHRRFSRRVEDYARYRPAYPPALLSILEAEIGLTPGATIADIGAGTGIFTRLLLDSGCTVYAVEPNAEMRATAAATLAPYALFHSVDGTAGDTTLPDASIDYVTAAQAFHWFDAGGARREFRRILRPGGFVVLVYNSWRDTEDAFAAAYDALVSRFDPEHGQRAATPGATERGLVALYGEQYVQAQLPNPYWDGWPTFRGRVLSSSYTPLPDHPDHDTFLVALRQLFDAHEQDGRVRFPYVTRLYWGRLA